MAEKTISSLFWGCQSEPAAVLTRFWLRGG